MDAERVVFWLVCASIVFTSFVFPVVIMLLVVFRQRREESATDEPLHD